MEKTFSKHRYPGRKARITTVAITLFSVLQLSVWNRSYSQAQLNDYLKIAAENNPSLRSSFLQYLAAVEEVPQVGSLPDPEVTIGYFIEPMERFMGNQRAEISLMQMFPWFGMLKTQKNEAALMAEARYQAFLTEKNQLFFEVKDSWYSLYLLEKQIAVAQKNLALLKTLERVALTRYQNTGTPSGVSPAPPSGEAAPASESGTMRGMNTQNQRSQAPSPTMGTMSSSSSGTGMSDVLWIKMEVKEIENTIALLEDSQKPLRVEFNTLLNRSLEEPVHVPDTLMPGLQSEEEYVFVDSLIEANPMIAMLKKENEALEAQRIMAKKEGYPMFGLGVNYSIFSPRIDHGESMGGRNMFMPMASFTIPIYRKKYSSKIKETQLLREATEQQIMSVKNELYMDLSTTLKNIEDAERRITLYGEQLELAQQSLNILLSAYSSQGAEFDKLLSIHRQLLDYQIKLQEAIVEQNKAVAMLDMILAKELPLR